MLDPSPNFPSCRAAKEAHCCQTSIPLKLTFSLIATICKPVESAEERQSCNALIPSLHIMRLTCSLEYHITKPRVESSGNHHFEHSEHWNHLCFYSQDHSCGHGKKSLKCVIKYCSVIEQEYVFRIFQLGLTRNT